MYIKSNSIRISSRTYLVIKQITTVMYFCIKWYCSAFSRICSFYLQVCPNGKSIDISDFITKNPCSVFCQSLINTVHKTPAAEVKINDLWCYTCETMEDGEACVDFLSNRSSLAKQCKADEYICMVGSKTKLNKPE